MRVFDGTRRIAADSVLVEKGLVAQVGEGLVARAGLPVFDGGGGTLLPGLIDAHVHVNSVASRQDAPRFGVTTMLDMFTFDVAGFAAERAARDRTDRADVWSAGTLVTAPKGHGTQYGRPIPTLERGTAAAFVADRLREGSDFIKLVIEDMSAYGARWPTLTTDQVNAVVAAAHSHRVLAVVHVSTTAAAQTAAAAGADALVHVPSDRALTPAQVETIRGSGMAVVATLSVVAGVDCSDHADQLRRDPAIDRRLTAEQRAHLGTGRSRCLHGRLDHATANVKALQRAGVQVLAGSDAPNPQTTYGASLLGELSLLVQAGMTPVQALHAATTATANSFRLADRGRIAPGQRADLLLVDGDPTTNIENIRAQRLVWKNGYPLPG